MAGPIRISVLANASQANRTLQDTASRTQKIGSSFRKMAIPATLALGAIVKVGKDALDSVARIERINAQTSTVIQSTGRAAGVSAKHVENFTGKLEGLTATEAESIQEGANVLLTFTNIRNGVGKTNKIFDKSVRVVTDMSRALGTDLKAQSIQVGKALNDPIKGISALSKVGVSFTAQQKKQIESLTKSGKTMKAQKIILAELNKEFGGSGKAFAGTTAGQIELAKHEFGTLTEALVVGLLPAIRKLAQGATAGFKWLEKHQTAAKALVIGLAALAASILAVNVAMSLNPAVLIVLGLVALGAALVVAYQKSETFRNIVQNIADFVRGQVLPALVQFGGYLQTKVLPAVVATAQKIGQKLKPILAQIAVFIQDSVVPALKQIAAKFREWWPTIQKIIVAVAKLYAKFIVFEAMIAGKVIPIILKIAGFILRNAVPAILGFIEAVAKIIGKLIDFGKKVAGAAQDVAGFAKKVATKIAEVVTYFVQLPGKILSALGDLGSLLVNAGKDLIQGLIDGIGSMFDSVKGKLGELTGKLTSWKGPPKKDKVLLRPAGRMIMQSLIDGFDDGTPGVKAVLGRITKLITTTINKRVKDDKQAKAQIKAKLNALRDEYAALTRNAKAQDKITAALEKQRDRLKDLQAEAKDYAAGIRDSVIAFGSVTAAGQNTGFADSTQLLDTLRARLAQAKEFAAKIKALIAAGLNKTTIQQLLDAGVEGGLGTASTILAGGSSVIDQVNSLTSQLSTAGQGLGSSAAQTMYGAGIQAAQGLIKGLEKQGKALDRIAKKLAETLINAVKKALDIHSPSRVFRKLGKFTAQGMTLGLNDVDVRGAGLRMADLLTRGFGAPDLAAYAGAGGVTQQIAVTVEVAPGANPVEVGRQLTKALDAYRRSGGRSAA